MSMNLSSANWRNPGSFLILTPWLFCVSVLSPVFIYSICMKKEEKQNHTQAIITDRIRIFNTCEVHPLKPRHPTNSSQKQCASLKASFILISLCGTRIHIWNRLTANVSLYNQEGTFPLCWLLIWSNKKACEPRKTRC